MRASRLLAAMVVGLVLTGRQPGGIGAPGRDKPASEDPEVTRLLTRLQDPFFPTRYRAAQMLGEMGAAARRAVPALTRALRNDEEEIVRMAAARALGEIGLDAGKAVQALFQALEDPDRPVQEAAAKALEKIIPPDRKTTVVALLAVLESRNPQARNFAARALARIDSNTRGVVAPLMTALAHRDRLVRSTATTALARVTVVDEADLLAVIGAVEHKEERIRRGATLVLGKIGPAARAGVPTLVRALRFPDKATRQNILAALEAIGMPAPGTEPELRSALTHPSAAVRQGAAQALGALAPRTPESVLALDGALKDRDKGVRLEAAAALGRIGPAARAGVPGLVRLLRDRDSEVQQTAATALGKMGPDARAAVAPLQAILRDPRAAVRQSAAMALGRIGPEARGAVPALAAALDDPEAAVRQTAARALGRIGPEARGAAPALAAALDDPDAGVATVAATALLAISPDSKRVRDALRILARVLPAAGEAVPEALATQRVGAVTYFRVTVKTPGDFRPAPREDASASFASPRLISQDTKTAAVYFRGREHPRPGENLEFIGQVRGDGPATLILTYPSTRGSAAAEKLPVDPGFHPAGGAWARLTLDFTRARKLAPPKRDTPEAGDNLQRDWAQAQARRLAILATQTPDFSFYDLAREATSRKYGVAAPALPRPEAQPAEEWYRQLYELLTGASALTESLAQRRLLARGRRTREPRLLDVARLPGIELREHPWEKMAADNKPAPEPLARLAPHDNYYVAFKSIGALQQCAGLLDRWGTNLIRAYQIHNRDYRLRDRYEQQLCLPTDALAATLRPGLIRGLALTGSDPYLREGSDVTVLFHVTDRKTFLAAVQPFLNRARKQFGPKLKEAKSDHAGVAVESFRTPLREVSLYRAAVGDVVVYSNSPIGLRRVLDVHAGKRPALADALDFRYMRTVFRHDDAKEDGFAYLSDAFIRRLVGPACKIKQKRRLEALAGLSVVTHGALFSAWESGRLPADHEAMLAGSRLRPAEVEDPEGKPVLWDGERGQAVSATYNTLRFATPLIELPIDKVTDQEEQDYEWFRTRYLSLWRRFSDPVALRLSLAERQVRVETYILPLIRSAEYDDLRRWVGGTPVAFDPAITSPKTLFQVAISLSAIRGLTDTKDSPGDWALLSLDDGPEVRLLVERWVRQQLRPSAKDSDIADPRLLFQLPLTLGVQGGRHWDFDALQQWLLVMVGASKTDSRKLLHRGVTITQIRNTSSRPNKVPVLYHAQVGKVWYLSFREESLRGRIDQQAARDKGPAPKKTVMMNASVLLAPRALDRARGAIHRYLEWETHRRAVGNGPLWYALYRSGVLPRAATASVQEEATLRLLGFVPVSPDGAPYFYDRLTGEVWNTRHGSQPWPHLYPDLAEKAPLRQLLDEFRTLRVDLSFREDGVHTVLTIERKK